MALEKAIEGYTKPLFDKNGNQLIIKGTVNPLKDDQEEITGYIIIIDINK